MLLKRLDHLVYGCPRPGEPRELLQQNRQTPQLVSYLAPILQHQGYCSIHKDGPSFVVTHRGRP